MPSHKTFRIKQKLAKKQRQNRPIPYWIRMRTDNTIRYLPPPSSFTPGTTPSAGTGAAPSSDSKPGMTAMTPRCCRREKGLGLPGIPSYFADYGTAFILLKLCILPELKWPDQLKS
ncbi:60S ribosomal protein L39 [Triticum urartu]|uniref:60S ribosomal protein L39 n=1 Tax=Triticum urartu TaxID=4572 RepID=M7Y712_TRIUA|nr:60S ribosomal protein L39 [Triticum urartu]